MARVTTPATADVSPSFVSPAAVAAPVQSTIVATVLNPVVVTAAPAAAVPPVVTATPAPSGSLAGHTGSLLSLLAGGNGGAPAAAPLAWTAAAVSRRDIRRAVTMATAASVATSTGQPYVRSISLPFPRTYGTGKKLTFTLKFNEAVKVLDPSVFVPIQIGFAMANAQYVGGNGTNRLTFALTVPENVSGGLNIGRVSNRLLPGATAPVRIFDFNGVGHEQPPSEVTNPKIVDMEGNPALETIPAANTSRITVDATGPGVVGYGSKATDGTISNWTGPFGLLHLTWTRVNFDQAVFVKGRPSIPVSIGGKADALNYLWGGWTPKLTFAKVSFGAAPGPVSFYSNGQVIDLPTHSNITDRLGNSAPVALDDFKKEPGTLGPPLTEDGNRLLVIGAHYQSLGPITSDQLNTVLDEAGAFYTGPDGSLLYNPYALQDGTPAPYLKGYQPPTFATSTHGVDLYRVAYVSTIPEQDNRPTLAYGLLAIPQGTTGPLPVVSYQHGTVIGKGEVPSQSFNWLLGNEGAELSLYEAAYETRLNVAQFGGQGYAVMAADYFGLGNSLEDDAYFSKPSAQQATLDMYKASVQLLASKGQPVTKLFLDGWSQGGLVTMQFQEKLQSEGIPVTAVGTAAGPANLQLATNSTYFNPRTWPASYPNTPGAIWANVPTAFDNFSVPGYVGDTGSPLDLMGVNYEVSRALYMREYKDLLFPPPNPDNYNDPNKGAVVIRSGLADALLPYSFNLIFAPQYTGSANEPAYAQTNYAQLLAAYGAGQNYLSSPMQTYYGLQDEVLTVAVGSWLYDWQTQSFGKSNIEAFPIASGNHRATYLSAVAGELGWFNSFL